MRSGWSALLFLCAGAVCLAAPSGDARSRDSSGVKRILVLGDSLSDGFMLRRSQAYPALLAEKLHAAGLDAFVITNASQSGGTSAGGLERLLPHLKQPVDIFILELGINDVFLGVPVDQIRANLQSIIDQVRAHNPGVRLVITGMEVPNLPADDYLSAFTGMYRDLAEKNGAALVPSLLAGVSGDGALNLPDRLHPNAEGHKVLARNVWQVLEPIAREVGAETHASVR